jgi:hypothetical protein
MYCMQNAIFYINMSVNTGLGLREHLIWGLGKMTTESFVLSPRITLKEKRPHVWNRSHSVKRKGAVWVCVGVSYGTPPESNSSEMLSSKCRHYEYVYYIAVICPRNFIIRHFKSPERIYGLVVRVTGYRSRGPAFDSRRYQIFWEVLLLERGPLSLVRIIEELLEWKNSGSGLENRN